MRIEHEGTTYEVDDELSFKIFTNWNLKEHQFDFNGKTVYASSFYNETPDSDILPDGIKDVTFLKCDLNNIIIPEGNTVIDCSQERIELMNDMRDWITDPEGNAQKVVGEEYWVSKGVSVDPQVIPSKKIKLSDNVDLAVAVKEATDAVAIDLGISIGVVEEVIK